MIIDFHTHIFPKTIRKKRENYFSGEPAFKLLYDSSKSQLKGASDIIGAMDENEVDVSVVFGFPWKNPETARRNNDYIMEVCAKYPARLKGFSCFDPVSIDPAKETQRCLDGGLSGVGELAFYQSGIDSEIVKRLVPVMEICLKKDLPVLIHTNEPVGHNYPGKTPNTLAQIYQLAKHFPDNKIVLAHFGGGIFFYMLLKREVADVLKNVYFDTAASPFLYTPEVYKLAMTLAGKDKILFGSDYPLLLPQRYFKEIENSGLSKTDQADICGNNAARLLGLDPGTLIIA